MADVTATPDGPDDDKALALEALRRILRDFAASAAAKCRAARLLVDLVVEAECRAFNERQLGDMRPKARPPIA